MLGKYMASVCSVMLIAIATSAWGQVGDESRNIVRVSLSDLDLTRADDRTQLDRRLKSAVEEVCGSPSSVDLVSQNNLASCRDLAEAQALVQKKTLLKSSGSASHQPRER